MPPIRKNKTRCFWCGVRFNKITQPLTKDHLYCKFIRIQFTPANRNAFCYACKKCNGHRGQISQLYETIYKNMPRYPWYKTFGAIIRNKIDLELFHKKITNLKQESRHFCLSEIEVVMEWYEKMKGEYLIDATVYNLQNL